MRVINTTAFVVALLVTLGYYFFSVRKWKGNTDKTMIQQQENDHTLTDVHEVEEDLIPVITAAIHEFSGTGDFQVVKIKPSAQNWTLTGRQNLISKQ